MARNFRSGGRNPLNPWFRVGEFDVTTTVLVSAVAVASFFVYALDKSVAIDLFLYVPDVRSGQIWRLVTWPLFNEPDIWTLLTIVIFWFLGRQLESEMGRFKFTGLLVWMTVFPALVVTALDLQPGLAAGIRMLELGVFACFAAEFPGARFFFNIPARVLAAVIIGIDILQFTGNRWWDDLTFLLLICATGLIALRQYGYAHDLTFIPRLALPGRAGKGRPASGRTPARRKKRNQPDLRVVQSDLARPLDRTTQEEVDALLDKIAANGLDSLTPEERRRLDQASKRLRGD